MKYPSDYPTHLGYPIALCQSSGFENAALKREPALTAFCAIFELLNFEVLPPVYRRRKLAARQGESRLI